MELSSDSDRAVDRLPRQQAALIRAASLGVPFCKICRTRPVEDDLLIEAGCGWDAGVVGRATDGTSRTLRLAVPMPTVGLAAWPPRALCWGQTEEAPGNGA